MQNIALTAAEDYRKSLYEALYQLKEVKRMKEVSEIETVINTEKITKKINQLKSLLQEVKELAASLDMSVSISIKKAS